MTATQRSTTLEQVAARLAALERENARLHAQLAAIDARAPITAQSMVPPAVPERAAASGRTSRRSLLHGALGVAAATVGLGHPTSATAAALPTPPTSWKTTVRVATTGTSVTLSGTQTIDGVPLAVGNRVLVKDQTTASQNGIYIVASGPWPRAGDANSSFLMTPEMAIRVSEGTLNAHTEWFLATQNPITLGTTNLIYAPLLPWADVKAFGAKGDGTTDDTGAFRAALAAAAGGTVSVPPGTYLLTAALSAFLSAGTRLVGESKWTSIVKVRSGSFSGSAVFLNPGPGTSAYCAIERVSVDLNGTNVRAVDLTGVNNSMVRDCYIQGGTSFASRSGSGITFADGGSGGAYSNVVQDCALHYLNTGVQYAAGGNQNLVLGGEAVSCGVGVDASPGTTGAVDSPKVLFTRFEDCDTAVLEGALHACYHGLQFEANHTADFAYTSASRYATVFGCYHTDSPQDGQHRNLTADMWAVVLDSNSLVWMFAGGGTFAIGDNVWINADPRIAVEGVTHDATLYAAGGRVYVDSQQWLCSRNAAGTGTVYLVSANAQDQVQIGQAFTVPTQGHPFWTGPTGNVTRPGPVMLGALVGANMNTTADQAIPVASANYLITEIIVTNASVALTAAQGGIYTQANKQGTALVAATQGYAGLTTPLTRLAPTLVDTDRQSAATLYVSLITPQGASATADFYVFGYPLD